MDADIPLDIEGVVGLVLGGLGSRGHGGAVRKACTYLSCTAFGLREAEVMELLASTEYGDERRGEVSATDWMDIKDDMGE